jgi:hypothetical protein
MDQAASRHLRFPGISRFPREVSPYSVSPAVVGILGRSGTVYSILVPFFPVIFSVVARLLNSGSSFPLVFGFPALVGVRFQDFSRAFR